MVKLEKVTARLKNAFPYNYTSLDTPVLDGGWSPTNTEGHKRKLSASSLLPAKRQRVTWCAVASATLFALWLLFAHKAQIIGSGPGERWKGAEIQRPDSEPPVLELGQSVDWNGTEIFWWEQFTELKNYYSGWQNIVPYNEYIPEQRGNAPSPRRGSPLMVQLNPYLENGRKACTLDDGTAMPALSGFDGLPQGMPASLFGSHEEVGFRADVCYDRINRYAPYGLGYDESRGGLGIGMTGDNSGIVSIYKHDYRGVNWGAAQEKCLKQNLNTKLSRTAFVIRAWHDLKWTAHRIMILRAIIAELSLASGGQYEVHFLIDVHDESIPIWADGAVYNETLKNALPEEFAGMGTLWSVSQMRIIYPGPFDEFVNFSGDDLYHAYRSLHFSMQHFASKHPEYDYFWHWEIDLRVTGHYYELLDRITQWAGKQPLDHLWERNAHFFIPSLYHGSYAEFADAVIAETNAQNATPISGPQLPSSSYSLLLIPPQQSELEITDLITLNPIFDPSRSCWAFRDDITGYGVSDHYRPPTRASLITATRMSRRLLLLMHQETFRNKHTMFPEMYPASIALQYGLKAVAVPMPVYFEQDWEGRHADVVFNNSPLRDGEMEMDHGEGRFHGEGGSVFGPAEHVFRRAGYYSNANFAGELWRAWLGGEDEDVDREEEKGGRMCLPMMVLHPVKYE